MVVEIVDKSLFRKRRRISVEQLECCNFDKKTPKAYVLSVFLLLCLIQHEQSCIFHIIRRGSRKVRARNGVENGYGTYGILGLRHDRLLGTGG